MAQTKEGAITGAARRIGLTYDEFMAKEASGLKWCGLCRIWHGVAEFGTDISRRDGLAMVCAKSRNARSRSRYKPKPRPAPGRSFVPARDGDKKQARRRVNYFVESGLIPAPNDIPCVDCGHVHEVGGTRHEYDHYLGYASEHHESVQSVCSKCHHRRGRERRASAKRAADLRVQQFPEAK